MAKNEQLSPGRRITIAVPAGVVSGDPVAVGELVGVAQIDRQSDGNTTIDTEGVYELTITGAISLGAPVYAVVVSGLVTSLTATATNNTRYGTALAAQGGTGKIPVKIGYP